MAPGAAPAAASARAGAASAVPFAVAAIAVGASFGVLAVEAGFPPLAAVVMSAFVHAGSAQFAALSILGAGGSVGAAVAAGTLINGRFLPMGLALGPSLPGGPLWRAVQGQAVVDVSWALAAQDGGRFDRFRLFGAAGTQWVGWTGGTALGALGAGAVGGELDAVGLDAVYPAFFLALLASELKTARGRGVALAAALLALALVPLTPPGVPVIAAALVALVGLRAPTSRPLAAA